jgi:hypothetical protein
MIRRNPAELVVREVRPGTGEEFAAPAVSTEVAGGRCLAGGVPRRCVRTRWQPTIPATAGLSL